MKCLMHGHESYSTRQVVAGILTITMLMMLGQMLHRDYFDAVQVQGDAHDIVFHGSKVALEEDGLVRSSEGPWMEDSHQLKPYEEVSSKGYVTFSLKNGPGYHISQVQGDAHDIVFHGSKVALEEDGLVRSSEGPWMEDSHQLKPCWSISEPDEEVLSKGYVTFSLTNGPEYHISQITDAVMVAKVVFDS
ncbi:hypothetical protein N665_1046s0004 [Sinapis alba]|nr:hypothetical protein N665_1046s0004 [Sinapis alba]